MAERWLTYQQAGELLGMSADAARQRARRLKWRTQPGNDGRALVLVPDDVEARPRVRTLFQPPVQPAEQVPVQPPGQTGDANALAALLREQIERAEAAIAAVQARAERAELRAEKAEAEAATERARAAQADAEREAARIAAAAAEGEAKGLQVAMVELREALAEARRPFWRRWIG